MVREAVPQSPCAKLPYQSLSFCGVRSNMGPTTAGGGSAHQRSRTWGFPRSTSSWAASDPGTRVHSGELVMSCSAGLWTFFMRRLDFCTRDVDSDVAVFSSLSGSLLLLRLLEFLSDGSDLLSAASRASDRPLPSSSDADEEAYTLRWRSIRSECSISHQL